MEKKYAVLESSSDVADLKGLAFEEYLRQLFIDCGYSVEKTPASGDYGADLVMAKDGTKIAVQAKQYASTVGFDSVKEAFFAKTYYEADEAWVVSTSTYTTSAIEAAKKTGVRLIDGYELDKFIAFARDEARSSCGDDTQADYDMARRNYGKLEPVEKPNPYRYETLFTKEPYEIYEGEGTQAIVALNPGTMPTFYVFDRIGDGPLDWELDRVSENNDMHDLKEWKRRREVRARLHRRDQLGSDGPAMGGLQFRFDQLFDMQRKPSEKPAYDYQPAPIVKEPVERVRSSKTRFFGVSFKL